MNRPRQFQSLETGSRGNSRRWNFSAASAVLVLAALPAAALHQPIPDMDPKSGIAITLESPFETLPPLGYVPMRLIVKNDSDRDRAWNFSFHSRTYYDDRQSFDSGVQVSVPAKAQRIVETMVPLAGVEDGYAYPQLGVTVYGYGAGSGSAYQWAAGGVRYSSGGYTPFTAMSETLGTTAWGPIEALMRTGGVELVGTQFDVAKAPGDHRGWLGCDGVWISTGDWDAMDANQKQALLDWVKLGGRVYACANANAPEKPVDLPAPGRLGLGEIEYEISKNNTDFTSTAARKIKHGDRLTEDISNGYTSGWGLRANIPAIVVNAALIMLFVCVFAAVVGPVNLFVLARRQKHMHLFWTTPALSIAASLLLALLIILQDGFGGRGYRLNVVYLDGTAHKAYTLQEQACRTGVLLSRDIPTREAFFLTPVRMDSRVSRHNARFRSTDNLLSGDWFASRTVQGHVIAAVQPTRARVEFGEDGGVPVAISSMGSTLTELFYRDARGGYWRVQDLNTGERKRMQKADAKAFDAWRSNAAKSFGARLRKTFPDDRNATDFFYATASGTTEQCIPTLPAVNWTQEGLIYFGPATRAGATATGDRT